MKPFHPNPARSGGGLAAWTWQWAGRLLPWNPLLMLGVLLPALGGRVLADDTNSPALSPQDYF